MNKNKAYLYWNQFGYIVRSKPYDKAVGFSSSTPIRAVEEAESNGFEVYWLESPVRQGALLNLPDFNKKPMFS